MTYDIILENWNKFLKEQAASDVYVETNVITESKKKSDDRCTRIAKRKYDVWPCVPIYSEALTKEGWKKYDQLIIGETILSYDIESDTLKWTEIKNLHFYENAKTIKMSKQFFEVVSTPDHKWVAYNKNMGYKKIINNEKIDLIFNTIKEANEGKISVKEAEEKCNSFRYYYKKYNNETIDRILQDSKNSKGGVKLIETKNLTNSMGLLTTARLDDSYRPLQLGKISKYGENWISKILNMSVDQIDSFFASAIIYHGNQITDLMLEKNVGIRKTENTYGFKQKDKMHGDIFELAAFLSGRNVMRGKTNKDNITSFYVRDKRYIPLDVVKFEEHTQQDVWCPETIYGTWVMRQNSRIMITGNSAYASGAVVRCRQGKIWKGISENATDEEIDHALLLEELNMIEEVKKKPYKPNFSKEKEQGLHGWFARNDGKGWINCRTGGPCGRDSADKGGKYPACRPTKAQCKSAGKGPLRKKKSSSPISWTKKKKD